jgi:hypothetical protein
MASAVPVQALAVFTVFLVLGHGVHGCSFDGSWEISEPLGEFPVNKMSQESVMSDPYGVCTWHDGHDSCVIE